MAFPLTEEQKRIVDDRGGELLVSAAAGSGKTRVLVERLMKGCRISFAPANMNRQRAASVGALALLYYQQGKTETAAEHKPDYLRMSQAERERKERMERDSVSM